MCRESSRVVVSFARVGCRIVAPVRNSVSTCAQSAVSRSLIYPRINRISSTSVLYVSVSAVKIIALQGDEKKNLKICPFETSTPQLRFVNKHHNNSSDPGRKTFRRRNISALSFHSYACFLYSGINIPSPQPTREPSGEILNMSDPSDLFHTEIKLSQSINLKAPPSFQLFSCAMNKTDAESAGKDQSLTPNRCPPNVQDEPLGNGTPALTLARFPAREDSTLNTIIDTSQVTTPTSINQTASSGPSADITIPLPMTKHKSNEHQCVAKGNGDSLQLRTLPS